MGFFEKPRAVASVTALLSMGAFAAILMALISGSDPTLLPNAQLMTLNVSQIGQTPLFQTSSNPNCKRDLVGDITNGAGNLVNGAQNGINCATNAAENGINGLVANAAGSLTSALNLPDFFDVHVMNFCDGTFNPEDYVKQGISNPGKDVTFCSPKSTSFSFNPTEIIQGLLPSGVSLSTIQWPAEITEAQAVINTATHILIIFYATSAAFTGLSVLMSIFNLVKNKQGIPSMILFTITFLTVGVASGASSVVIVKAVSIINDKGAAIGVGASQGHIFLLLTWVATVAMLGAVVIGIFGYVKGRRGGGGDGDYYD